jgi:HAD superfamily hydrolase (TIGR01459 family)
MEGPLRTHLASLIGTFDTFFVDQFGVLHDGQRPYDGAIDALRHIRARGKRVVLLSNSGKRTAPNAERLHGLGFPRDCYDRLLTSGEVAWHMLANGRLTIPYLPERPLRCLLLMRGDDRSSVAGLGYGLVDRGDDADLVLIGGSEGDRLTLAEYEQRLRPAAARKVPALCTNPDKVMLTASGPCFGAGRIAELYEQLGGSVTWIGKPFADIYRVAIEEIEAASTDGILCIGDSIEHDIAGARRAGLTSALVRSGILAALSDAELDDICRQNGATPDFVVSAFSLTVKAP